MGIARAAAALLLVAVALIVAGWPAPRVQAHAVLERSLPAQNQQLAEPPELVETWYSEPLERSLTKLEVLDTQGNAVHVGETRFSDDALYAAIALPPDLGPGIYTVTYQNVSKVDGHQWSGFFSFIILNPDGSVPAGRALTPEGFAEGGGGQGFLPGVGDSTLRWFGLLAAMAVVSATAFYLFIARPAAQFLGAREVREVEEAGMAMAADLAALAVPVLIFSLAGQLFLLAERLGGLEAVDDVLLRTRTGELWLSRTGLALALLVIFGPALARQRHRMGGRALLAAGLGLLAGTGMLITYSLGSHAAAGGGAFWAVSSDFVHFVAMAAWVGGLLQLGLAFWWTRGRLQGEERLLYLANVLDRFSWLAVISLALLIGTGVFNAFVQLPTASSLWETTYGRVLIAKLSLILPLLGVAGLNAVLLKPALVRAIDGLYQMERANPNEEDRPWEAQLGRLRRLLPRAVVAEFVLALAVLVATAVLSQTTPALGELRQAQAEPAGDFSDAQQAADLNVQLDITPFVVGINTYTVTLAPQPGAELGEVLQVRLRFLFDDPNAPARGGGTPQVLTPQGQNTYTAEGSFFSQAGAWRVEAEVRRRGQDDLRVAFPMLVGGAAATLEEPEGLFALPFTFVDWNVVAGGALVALGLGAVLIWRARPPAWQPATATSLAVAGVFSLMAGGVLLFGVHAHEPIGFNDPSPIPRTEDSIALGRARYETNCQVCHGPRGRGDGPLASELPVPPADFLAHVPYHGDGLLFTWISEGIPLEGENKNMPSFKNRLTEEERWHLVNFLRETFGSRSPREFTPVRPATPTPAPGQASR